VELESDRWNIRPVLCEPDGNGRPGRTFLLNGQSLSDPGLTLSSQEKFALNALNKSSHKEAFTYNYDGYAYGGGMGHVLNMIKGATLIEGKTNTPVTFYPEKIKFRIKVKTNERGAAQLTAMLLHPDGSDLGPLDEHFFMLTAGYHYLYKGGVLYFVDVKVKGTIILAFTQKKNVEPPGGLDAFMTATYPLLLEAQVPVEFRPPIALGHIDTVREKRLHLKENGNFLEMGLSFIYDRGLEINYPARNDIFVKRTDTGYTIAHRDKKAESQTIKSLLAHNVKEEFGLFYVAKDISPLEWLFNELPALEADGLKTQGREKLERFKILDAKPKLYGAVHGKTDWFDLNLELDFDGIRISAREIAEQLQKTAGRFVRLSDGRYAQLTREIVEGLSLLQSFGKKVPGNDMLRFGKNNLLFLDMAFENGILENPDGNFKNKLQNLKSFKEIKKVSVPRALQGKLRPYQQGALEWLTFLHEFGYGGCLADDMGLGKTVQTLALLLARPQPGRPSLIVAPTSVIFNWEKEIEKFAPTLSYYLFYGIGRNKDLAFLSGQELIITTYALMRRDVSLFASLPLYYLILDESQKIKNPQSQTAKAAFKLTPGHRLALSGTPIENNVGELWSLFRFLNPGMLGSFNFFRENFADPIEMGGDRDRAEKLNRLIYPFVLRRKKEDVAPDLPPKTETVFYCEMDSAQQEAYNKWRDYYRAHLLKKIDAVGVNKSKISVLEGLLRLRQISIHPHLADEGSPVTPSPKYTAVLELIDEIVKEGHKALIFSQFVKALDLLRNELEDRALPFAYLDGRTRGRQAQVDRFQDDPECKLFLISLKAGGSGINLTAAEYVVHLDPWWNPAVEAQASDRAHRIGQKKQVFVYKMITRGSVEEKILQLQKRKKGLSEQIIPTDSTFFKTLERADIENLFS